MIATNLYALYWWKWSGWLDLNQRPLRSKRSTLIRLSYIQKKFYNHWVTGLWYISHDLTGHRRNAPQTYRLRNHCSTRWASNPIFILRWGEGPGMIRHRSDSQSEALPLKLPSPLIIDASGISRTPYRLFTNQLLYLIIMVREMRTARLSAKRSIDWANVTLLTK